MLAALKRLVVSAAIAVALAALVGPWALYGIGLYAVHGKPELPHVIAPRASQLAVWEQFRGTGEPAMSQANPYTYVPLSFSRGPHRTSLLLAWRVATRHYELHPRYHSMLWRQLACGALVIWISNTWSAEQVLSKVVELGNAGAA
jgi:hypothetical protein